jgi:hypothetical protein
VLAVYKKVNPRAKKRNRKERLMKRKGRANAAFSIPPA